MCATLIAEKESNAKIYLLIEQLTGNPDKKHS